MQPQPLSQDEKPIVTPAWLEESIEEGERQPYDQYQALYVRRDDSVHGEEPVTSAQGDLSPTAKFACQRESPLVCPNQELVEQLNVLKLCAELDVNPRETHLAYARAIAVGSSRQSCTRHTNPSSR